MLVSSRQKPSKVSIKWSDVNVIKIETTGFSLSISDTNRFKEFIF